MKALRNNDAFSLVELLMAMAIFGVVMASLYSVFIAMKQTTSREQGVIDIQQNLRVAMDMLSNDIRMAGALSPLGDPTAPPIQGTADTLDISVGSSEYRFAQLSSDLNIPLNIGKDVDFVFHVIDEDMVNQFSIGDRITIIRPNDHKQPHKEVANVVTSDLLTISNLDPSNHSITIKGFATPNDGKELTYRSGDIIAAVTGSSSPESISWFLNDEDGDGDDDLVRSKNGGPNEIVVENIDSLQFNFLSDADGEINAVQISMSGLADYQAGKTRTRSLNSTVYLRNI